MGEGYHNYHHSFPYDYSASELGWKDNFNPATAFIDLCAWFELAYDLKVVPDEVVEKRVLRTGDKSLLHHRKPRSKTMDFLIGLIYVTWPLWFSFSFKSFYWNFLV